MFHFYESSEIEGSVKTFGDISKSRILIKDYTLKFNTRFIIYQGVTLYQIINKKHDNMR